jgi:hypothetical protein
MPPAFFIAATTASAGQNGRRRDCGNRQYPVFALSAQIAAIHHFFSASKESAACGTGIDLFRSMAFKRTPCFELV